jgi:methylmalonyl-CoA/ethylmalonyl-CoA epimerase
VSAREFGLLAANAAMNRFGLTFHHLALAVRDPKAASGFLSGLGYSESESVFDPAQGVRLAMCSASEHPQIELVSPAEMPGPIDNILKRDAERIYHLCYTSEDATASVAAMRDAGLRVMQVAPQKPAILFGGDLVSFYYVRGFGLIEILQNRTMTEESTHEAD